MPSKDQIMALVQSLAMIFGTMLVARGAISSDQAAGFSSEVIQVVGGLLALAGMIGNHLNADAPLPPPATPTVK